MTIASIGGSSSQKGTITIERTYHARIEEVWALWTTKDGIESWWGPDGFTVTVHSIDLRPGGELRYGMTATATPQIEFMKKAGMPLSTEHRVVYTAVVPSSRLAFTHLVDFVPGIEPYNVSILVELHEAPNGVRIVLTVDRMHDDVWTQRAVAGWESELRKLEKVLKAKE
ncbi:MAG TPA: SRPBCC domain-containing protein [Vicinamibacterales bacterium]|nr:SRPBCC domain-containing protein [Vicinamibacterales bacterium]